jgi:predicted nucleic acid-binding protein
LVVDASVVVKWYVPEIHSTEALRLLNGNFELHAPDLLPVELGSILWKKVRLKEIDFAEGNRIIKDFQTAPIDIHSSFQFLHNIFKISTQTDRSFYDCLYLTLAIELGCQMVTADRRFYDAMVLANYSTALLWAEDL